MIKCSRLEEYKNIEEKITKDVRKLFRLKIKKKKRTNNAAIKGIRNLFRLRKKINAIKCRKL